MDLMLNLQRPIFLLFFCPGQDTFPPESDKVVGSQFVKISEKKPPPRYDICKIQMISNWKLNRKTTNDIFTGLHRAQTAGVFLFILILFATGGSVLSVNTDRPWEISEIYCLTAFVFLTWPQKCRCQKAGEIKSLNHCCLRCLPTSAGMLYC